MPRHRFVHIIVGTTIALVLAVPGCGPEAEPDTPQLIAQMTLGPTILLPSASPTRTVTRVTTTATDTPTRATHTPAIRPPAYTSTPQATAPRWLYSATPIMVTATLRPSRTPTASNTPTHTATPTPTSTASPTRTPTTTPTLPGSGYALSSPVPTLTAGTACPYRWFFSPGPSTCPTGDPVSQAAAYQPFEHGAMIWLSAERHMAVLFNSSDWPRWVLIPDSYQEGMPDTDPAIIPPDGMVQPVRGFGLAWRSDPTLRARLGWALAREVGYTTLVQSDAQTGARYIQGPDTSVYVLHPDQSTWDTLR